MRTKTPWSEKPDAYVIGSGPNGLAAAVTMAGAGRSVEVYEAQPTIGGSTRSQELTLPGFIHDVCSCAHPMGASSPFFNSLGLEQHGLRWVQPAIALAHPFDDGDAAAINNPFEENLAQFGKDAATIRNWLLPLIENWDSVADVVLRPLGGIPKKPFVMAKFGLKAVQPATWIATKLGTARARAVFAGIAGHSILPFDAWMTSSFGILLWATCYSVGWPFAAGGSQSIANALASVLRTAGGEVFTGERVADLGQVAQAKAVLCDITPRQLLKISGERLSEAEQHRFENYRYGPGVFKMDWALDGPIPWNSPNCRRAGTIHIGGSFEEIAASEDAAWTGEHAERPFIILTQPSLFDPSRAPAGKHTAWGYCHVPNGSTVDMQERIEAQIERFAKGFRDRILARSAMYPADMERHNENLIGGDIGAGALDIGQFPIGATRRGYSTSIPNVFLCSATTPPGPGVHGMCGHIAANLALKKLF